MRGWASHRCGWPSEGEDPRRGGWGWEHAEATLSRGTSSVTAARSCGTEPGGGTAGQVFHPLPSAHHLGLAILLQGQDMRRPPSDRCQALLCLRKPQCHSLGNGIKSCGNELMLPLFNPLGTASRLKKKKNKSAMFVASSDHMGRWGIYKAVRREQCRTEPLWCVLPGTVLSLLLSTTTG